MIETIVAIDNLSTQRIPIEDNISLYLQENEQSLSKRIYG